MIAKELCVIPRTRFPTIRYVLVATSVIAVCLVVHQVPYSTETIVDVSYPIPKPIPFRIAAFLHWWPIEIGSFYVGIAMLMHVLTSLVRLSGWRQWLTAIVVPTFALTAWYSYSVRYLDHHPGSLNEYGHIQVGLIGSTIGFTIIAFVIALPKLIAAYRESKSS